jgi:hypothetical protein
VRLGVVWIATIASWQPVEHKSFPGALPGLNTDVSSAEAFHYYGIKAPPSMRGLRYAAASKDDTYPLVAISTVNCEEATFVSQSSLRHVIPKFRHVQRECLRQALRLESAGDRRQLVRPGLRRVPDD